MRRFLPSGYGKQLPLWIDLRLPLWKNRRPFSLLLSPLFYHSLTSPTHSGRGGTTKLLGIPLKIQSEMNGQRLGTGQVYEVL